MPRYCRRLIGDPVQGRENILFLDVDVAKSIAPKMAHDVVGGYQRYDVFDVRLNRRRQLPIRLVDEQDAGSPSAETPPGAPDL